MGTAAEYASLDVERIPLKLIEGAIAWVLSQEWAEGDSDYLLANRERIVRAIVRYYKSGWWQFVADQLKDSVEGGDETILMGMVLSCHPRWNRGGRVSINDALACGRVPAALSEAYKGIMNRRYPAHNHHWIA